MILALLLTVHALADSLVLRADELLYDSTVVALAPHGFNGSEFATAMFILAAGVIIVAGLLVWGVSRLLS